MEKNLLMIAALVGIVVGKFFTALAQGLDAYRPKQPDANLLAINILAQQNHLLMQHIVNVQAKFINEAMTSSTSESSSVGEIACKSEDIDLVRALLDDDAERVIKETAAWAHTNVGSYDLELRGVSIEPEKASDPDRANDVVLIFHVKGSGSDALRFQAECSRRLRDISAKTDGASTRCLRTDVRWI